MRYRASLILLVLLLSLKVNAQTDLLKSGPMVGYSSMMEVMLWVQTTKSAHVHFEYWNTNDKKEIFKTDHSVSNKESGFTVHIPAGRLEPGNTYEFELFINGQLVERPYALKFQTQSLWQWRTDPPEFSFVLGSCNYVNEAQYDRPGDPYGSNHQIFNLILERDPDFMLWLGDNTYLRETDWDSKTGIYHRYTHTRSLAELQPLLGGTHHYAIWDDHDYGPNNSDGSFVMKRVTEEAFKDFWANPNYDATGKGGLTGSFTWADCEFFLLDNRYFRSSNNNKSGDKQLLGEDQIEWLVNALSSSKASFKFVVMGGVWLNDVPGFERYSIFPEERKRVIQSLKESEVPGIVLISGDIHHSEFSKMEFSDHYPFYELTTSPLTAGFYTLENNENRYLVEGTEVYENNFAILNVSGTRNERVLSLSIVDAFGKTKWTKTIRNADLK